MLKFENAGKRLAALALCAGLAMSLPACQEDPSGTIVAHKDMDKLISQAAASDPGKTQAADLAQDVARHYETYQTTLDNENLGVKVNVNAQVEVPDVEKLSIYRVRQKKFDQAFLDKVRQELLGDKTLYDGAALEIRTKREVEGDVQSMRSEHQTVLDDMKENPDYTAEDYAEVNDSYQQSLHELQAEYEAAPDQIDLSQFPSDGQLRSAKEQYEQDPEDSYYTWQYQLNPDGEAFYGITDGSDGNYETLYMQNNADYSNKIMYTNNPLAYTGTNGILVDYTPLRANDNAFEFPDPTAPGFQNSDDPNIVQIKPENSGAKEFTAHAGYWQSKGVPGNVLAGDFVISENMEFIPVPGWTAELTQAEAESQAEAFMAKIGLEGFGLEEGGLFTELIFLPKYTGTEVPYGVYYILRYCRELDGVALTQSSGVKFAADWDQGGEYNKQMWPGECVEFRINDSGIVGFQYLAPLEVTETVVEGAALKPFEEVKGTFEQMLPVTLGSADYQHVAQVDKVRLSYSRISEQDSFDTGLVVPVWSFEGADELYSEGNWRSANKGTLLAVNAIDGSVIDAELGY